MADSHTGEPIAYLNGEFGPRAETRVSVLDRGFLFADGVYEVIPVYRDRPFRLSEHLQRLGRSLAALDIANPHSDAQWRQIVQQLAAKNGGGDLSIYLQITRGAPPARDHWRSEPCAPTIVGFSGGLYPPAEHIGERGCPAITAPDPRWQRCDIKSIALLPNILARRDAAAAEVMEVLFLRDGQLTEGAATNVFVVKAGRISTPPLSPLLLAGITRQAVIDHLAGGPDAVIEQQIGESELRDADEIWLSSSMREIVPITRLDDRPVGSGLPGPLWKRVSHSFASFVQAELDRLPHD